MKTVFARQPCFDPRKGSLKLGKWPTRAFDSKKHAQKLWLLELPSLSLVNAGHDALFLPACGGDVREACWSRVSPLQLAAHATVQVGGWLPLRLADRLSANLEAETPFVVKFCLKNIVIKT